MCRFIAYKGVPIPLEELLFKPKYSLIKQSFEATELEEPLNGDGFGIGWYVPEITLTPAVFVSMTPAWSNRNLKNMAPIIKSNCIFAHVRAASIGDITESDVMLAAASDAVVIGFHVSIVGTANDAAEKEQVDVRFYEIIYEVKSAIEKAMEGLLLPELKEVFVGMAEVRQVFKVSKIGSIAGCTVQKGKIVRNFQCRVMRNGAKVHEGKVESLKRFKDDAREVLEGFECGIGVSNFDEILPGDRIEVFEIQKKARKLE